MKRIFVIGSGSWGTALAILLCINGHDVTLWSYEASEADDINRHRENKRFLPNVKIPDGLIITHSKESAVNAEIIVLAVPSKFVRATLSDFVPFIRAGRTVVNVSKGLEEDSLKTLSEVIEEVLPMCSVAVLSGPSHAEEVSVGIPTVCVSSSKDIRVAEYIQDVFMSPSFRVYTNDDITGVELGGALKNLIALSAGICDGIGYGDNTKAALMTRGIAEITRLGVAMGAKAVTFSGLTGIGDLIVTCTSMHSRNRRAGILLGQGKPLGEVLSEIGMVVEGANTAKAAYDLSVKYNVYMPITTEINEVLFKGKNPKQAVYDLMTRDKNMEHKKELLWGEW